MDSTWHKLRPVVLAVGLHAALLAIILVGLLRQDAPRTSRAAAIAVDATVIAAPPDVVAAEQEAEASTRPPSQRTDSPARQQSSALANSSPSSHVPSNRPTPGRSPPRNAKSPAESARKTTTDLRQEPSSDASQQEAVQTDQSVAPSSDDDPFAEMRRERADAELRYRLTTQSNTNDQPAPPTRPGSASGSVPQNLDPALSHQDLFNVDAIALWPPMEINRVSNIAGQNRSCSGFDDPSQGEEANSDEMFDCLPGFPEHDSANPFARNAMSVIGPAPDAMRPPFDFCHSQHGCDD